MDQQRAEEVRAEVRAGVDEKILEALQAGDSAEAERLGQGYTSVSILRRLFGVEN